MPIHSFSDPDYFDAMTPDALRWAQVATREAEPGFDVGVVVMGEDPTDPEAPAALVLKLPPGGVLQRHAHDCFRVEVLVRGSMEVPGGKVLGPGDISTSRPGEFYGPNVAGPDGSLSVEIFSTTRGLSPTVDPEAGSEALEQTARVAAAIERAKRAAER